MTDVPGIFSGPMVRALIREVEHPGDGKTQTRRLAWRSKEVAANDHILGSTVSRSVVPSPWQKVKVGDRLWVRAVVNPAISGFASFYGSLRDEDEMRPLAKFCSPTCQKGGGPKASNVTDRMKAAARAKELRPPKPGYSRRTYLDALSNQQRQKRISKEREWLAELDKETRG